VRGWLSSLPADEAALVLDARELESLEFGSPERVTDMHLDHVRHLPTQLPAMFSPMPHDAPAMQASTASNSTSRTST
jgi:hypothetical protein